MKKIQLIFAILLVGIELSFAGGMVHNTNQSAAWYRTMVRDASTDIDAVFYNPAGVTKLPDGFHIQVNVQTISQSREVTNKYPLLNQELFEGSTFVPALPTAFFAYKTGKFAVHGGFTVIGGGGGAEFDKGLPSFEAGVAVLPAMLAGLAPAGTATGTDLTVTGYDAAIQFSGTSAYYGLQLGASYAINDMISVSLGGRYVMATNTYSGSIKDISVITASETMRADDFLNNKAVPSINAIAASYTGAAASVQPLIDGGAGANTFAQAQQAGFITAAQQAQLEGALVAAGYPANTPIAQAQLIYTGTAAGYTATSAQLSGTAAGLGDKEVDVKQTGSTFTPIIGLNLALLEDKLNIGIKYEMASKMAVKNETTKDDVNMFPNDSLTNADLPGMLSIGVNFKAMDNLSLSAGFHTYGDKAVSYGKSIKNTDGTVTRNVSNDQVINGNSMEIAFGVEYGISDMLTVSAGYLMASNDPKDTYQSDLSHGLKSNTVGFGTRINATEKLSIDLGFLYTMYQERSIQIEYAVPTTASYQESYMKSNWGVAAGLSISL